LPFGDHLIDVDENRLDPSDAVEVTGISIFMASTNATSSPSAMLAPASTWIAQTRPATSVTIVISGIPHSPTWRIAVAHGFLLWPQIA